MWKPILLITAGFVLCLGGTYKEGKRKALNKERGDMIILLWVLGIIILLVGMTIFFLDSQYKGCQFMALYQLDAPVTSLDELSEYEIIDLRYFKEKSSADQPEKGEFSADIKLKKWPSFRLDNIAISEKVYKELYEQLKKGLFVPQKSKKDPNTPLQADKASKKPRHLSRLFYLFKKL